MSVRDELHALVDRLADAIEKASTGSDWVDQAASPLGRAKHLALVHSGKLPGVKEGRQVLVRRADIDAYLAKHKVTPVIDSAVSEEQEAERLAASIGRRRK